MTLMVATRNRPQTLRACLGHAARQVGVELEVLLIDDRSDIDLGPVVEAFRERLALRMITLPRVHGCAGARNVGILESSNEVIIQLDDDSWLIEPDAARVVADYLLSNPDVGALPLRIFYPWLESPTGVGEVFRRWDRPHLSPEYSFHGCGVVLRRSVAVEAGLYPAAYTYGGQEDHLAAAILSAGYEVRFFGERGVVHGYDDLDEEPKTRERIERNEMFSASHVAVTMLRLLPFPLNVGAAAARVIAFTARHPRAFFAVLSRIAAIRPSVRARRMSFRSALSYLVRRERIRSEIRRRAPRRS